MPHDDVLKCPLCQGRAEVHRSELIGLLTDRSLPAQAEKYLAELLNGATMLTHAGPARDFETAVHSWDPQLPIWRRSPKE
jgi:hypothetical protein